MTEEEMRIAVAESVGLVVAGGHSQLANIINENIPNYPQDLNAMHEVEKTINTIGNVGYIIQLWELVRHSATDDYYGRMRAVASATAHQRCEAYLRVKGLWK